MEDKKRVAKKFMVNTSNNKEAFGQVFTSVKVAKFMVELISDKLTPNSTVLDPCIGGNVFLKEISKGSYKKMVGVELDTLLLNEEIEQFFNSKRELVSLDFFDYDYANTFDVIIMNPPYVRQELLTGPINSKKKIAKILGREFSALPKKTNLYIYFLLKALKHLKQDGKLVAIIYDSWLFTDFGQEFKKLLLDSYSINTIIHFRHGAFDKANVGATIITIEPNNNVKAIEYVLLDSPAGLPNDYKSLAAKTKLLTKEELIDFQLSQCTLFDLQPNVFQPMHNISNENIVRGLSATVNEFFIFEEDSFPPYTTKIVKNVTGIKTFEVKDEFNYLLRIQGAVENKDVQKHLDNITEKVRSNPLEYKSLSKRIISDAKWFEINSEVRGNIIFNYYMRDNIHFILNPKRHLVSDNFYCLTIEKNVYASLAVLNSIFTQISLLTFGKSQGRGLFKIQLRKFKEIPLIDLGKLSKKTIRKLEEQGKILAQTQRRNSEKILRIIDHLLLSEIRDFLPNDVSLPQLYRELDMIKGKIA